MTRPVPAWFLDPEDAFNAYLERSTNYFAAVEAAGGTPWHEHDESRRRSLFFRRYTRPAPPEGLLTDLADIRRAG